MTDVIDAPRNLLVQNTRPGCVSEHSENLVLAQKITEARYAHFKAASEVYPKSYPPPMAGDGADVFAAADEAGEGTMTYKEVAKFLGRNQNLRHRLQEGWESFNSKFDTENLNDLTKADFMKIWQEAAALRK
eukprot:TRINITY_DN36635_c0_g1_i1.p1 TRINITY_DN36635_c0_g1~~TRINITY_DN36635_c0_g1_i1.p1  ORF type:complete len:132 (+),score=30.01 TRINITY_DN36635_c0_g1_i1:63-458(+)